MDGRSPPPALGGSQRRRVHGRACSCGPGRGPRSFRESSGSASIADAGSGLVKSSRLRQAALRNPVASLWIKVSWCSASRGVRVLPDVCVAPPRHCCLYTRKERSQGALAAFGSSPHHHMKIRRNGIYSRLLIITPRPDVLIDRVLAIPCDDVESAQLKHLLEIGAGGQQ